VSMDVCRHCDNEHTCHNGRRQIHPELRREIQALLDRARERFGQLEAAATSPTPTGTLAAQMIWLGRIDAYEQTLRVLEY
jgi:hypothetical protein